MTVPTDSVRVGSVAAGTGETAGKGVMTPVAHRVVGRRRETDDVTTLVLARLEGVPMAFRSGQFNMVTAFGIGEAALSLSGAPDEGTLLQHTVRDVGPVTHALCRAQVGDLVGVRGPFGTDWGVGKATGPGGDVVVVAGGIGLAPLRGAVCELMDRRSHAGGRVFVIVGAREPVQIIFAQDLEAWARGGARVAVTVDVPGAAVGRPRGPGDLTIGSGGLRPVRRLGTGLWTGDHDPVHRTGPDHPGGRSRPHPGVPGAQHAVCGGVVRSLPARSVSLVPGWPGRAVRRSGGPSAE